ncbi:SRPBCC family protein [Leptobacterium sp. I13]|uniref:SRPBCC family protein n=1 Tax=Leptobacterium meishanense TaxID=3128904 RepID=UPI0030EE57D8
MGCYNSIVVDASADEVWSVLKNFHDLSWSTVVNKVEKIGAKNQHEVGAKRVLNDAFHETLLSIDNTAKKFTYSIDDGPDVVSKDNVDGYIGEVTVFPITNNNTAFVLWTSSWKAAKKDGVADFCNPIYHALLQDLKNHFS